MRRAQFGGPSQVGWLLNLLKSTISKQLSSTLSQKACDNATPLVNVNGTAGLAAAAEVVRAWTHRQDPPTPHHDLPQHGLVDWRHRCAVRNRQRDESANLPLLPCGGQGLPSPLSKTSVVV